MIIQPHIDIPALVEREGCSTRGAEPGFEAWLASRPDLWTVGPEIRADVYRALVPLKGH